MNIIKDKNNKYAIKHGNTVICSTPDGIGFYDEKGIELFFIGTSVINTIGFIALGYTLVVLVSVL